MICCRPAQAAAVATTLFLLLFLWTICDSPRTATKVTIHAVIYSEQEQRYYYPEFLNRSTSSHDPNRSDLVQSTIAGAAGVYMNKSLGAQLQLDSTVVVTVLAFNSDVRSNKHYKLYFHNFLCFTQHHGIDLIVYVAHHNLAESDIDDIKSLGVRVLTYPDELFWSTLSQKTNALARGRGRANYLDSDVPSFSSHGALVMLVPVLEVLLRGYSVLFFDIDIGLVVDPVPYMIRGSADLVFAQEVRHCPDVYHVPDRMPSPHRDNINRTQSSSHAEDVRIKSHHHHDQQQQQQRHQRTEPNTGTMLVRASAAGVRFFREWLHEIVQTNVMNDQKVLPFQALRAVYSPDCFVSFAPHAMPVSDAPVTTTHTSQLTTRIAEGEGEEGRHNVSIGIATTTADTARYCFLSELLFQNGETAFRCAVKGSYRDSWILEMFRHAVRRPDYSPAEVLALQGEQKVEEEESLLDASSIMRADNSSKLRFPVIVHANYCDRKSHELQVRGLWLLNRTAEENEDGRRSSSRYRCVAYDVQQTMYAKMDWVREVMAVRRYRRHLYETHIRNGSLVRGLKSREVYAVTADLQRRLVPDSATFAWLFGEHRWVDVRSLPEAVLGLVPIAAAPYPSVVERLVPQWKAMPGEGTSSSTTNTTVTVYRRIQLDNGTLVQSSSSSPAGKGSKTTSGAPKQSPPIYMLSIDRVYNDTELGITYSEVQRYKRAIPDRASFIGHFGEYRWKEVQPLPDYVLDDIEDGPPLSSYITTT